MMAVPQIILPSDVIAVLVCTLYDVCMAKFHSNTFLRMCPCHEAIHDCIDSFCLQDFFFNHVCMCMCVWERPRENFKSNYYLYLFCKLALLRKKNRAHCNLFWREDHRIRKCEFYFQHWYTSWCDVEETFSRTWLPPLKMRENRISLQNCFPTLKFHNSLK